MGRILTPIITVDDIMKSTRGGLDLFQNEVSNFSFSKAIPSPLRKDNNPSFSFFMSNGIVMYKDFSNGECGTIIQFLQSRYNLDFKGVLDKISNNTQIVSVVKDHNKVIKENKTIIDFTDKPFTEKHKVYWNKVNIDESFLNENDIFAVKDWAINKKKQKFTTGEYIFGYVYKDEKGKETGEVKLLRLGNYVSKENKWRTNVPNKNLWRLHKLDYNKKYLFIVKSLKDAVLLNKHFNFNTIALQNEDPNILLENNYDYLESLPFEKVVCLGSDPQGWNSSYLITYLTGWKYFNTPNNLYIKFGIQDPYDVASNLNINVLEKILLKKGYIEY